MTYRRTPYSSMIGSPDDLTRIFADLRVNVTPSPTRRTQTPRFQSRGITPNFLTPSTTGSSQTRLSRSTPGSYASDSTFISSESPIRIPADYPRDYEYIKTLGSGSYGEVSSARHKATGQYYAIKKNLLDSDLGYPTLIEIDIMSRVSHPNIMHIIELDFKSEHSYYVLPLGDTTLTKFIGTNPSNEVRMRLFFEIASAIRFLNDNGILHNDLKPDNIIIKDGKAIISDFGISEYMPLKNVPRTTPQYEAPEVVRYIINGEKLEDKNRINEKALDLWALGCVFFYILTGHDLLPIGGVGITGLLYQYHDQGFNSLLGIHESSKMAINQDQMSLLSTLLDPVPERRVIDIFSFPIMKTFGYTIPIQGVLLVNSIIVDYTCHTALAIMVDWICDVVNAYQLPAETLFLTVDLIYRVYSSIISDFDAEKGKVQLFGIACLGIATNLCQYYPMMLHDLLDITDNSYDSEQYFEMEAKVILALNGILYTNNFYTYAFSAHSLKEVLPYLKNCETYKAADPVIILAGLAKDETSEQRQKRQPKNITFYALTHDIK